MNKIIEEIKKSESDPRIIENMFNKEEINQFLNLYNDLPITVHNKKQNVIKKRWLQGYDKKIGKIILRKIKKRNW